MILNNLISKEGCMYASLSVCIYNLYTYFDHNKDLEHVFLKTRETSTVERLRERKLSRRKNVGNDLVEKYSKLCAGSVTSQEFAVHPGNAGNTPTPRNPASFLIKFNNAWSGSTTVVEGMTCVPLTMCQY